jgi:hypothetical protein
MHVAPYPKGVCRCTVACSRLSEERGQRQDEHHDGADGKFGDGPPEPAHGHPPARLETREQRVPRLEIPQRRARQGSIYM